jgi:hypothetical protein
MLTGKHLIAGNWVAGDATFKSEPAHGDIHEFAVGTPAHIDAAVKAAEEAFWSFGYSSRAERAALLNAIADEIEARGAEITAIGTSETGLPEARLQGERGRTTGQLRLFASHIEKGDYLDRRHDEALPDRAAAAASGPAHDAAPYRPGGRVRRVQLPAGLLDRGRRHRGGTCRRLPGRGQGPFRPSGHRRDRCPGHRRGAQEARHASRRLLADPGRQARCRPERWSSTR